MSAGWTVLTLCVCVCVPMGSHGALVISRDSEETTNDSGSRHLMKRSATRSEVEVLSIKVDSKVASRFAHTVMTTTALNKANSSKEALFDVELPKTAFITNFSMEVEGQVYVGEVKEKEKAKKQYDKAVSSGQTAGLVKASGRKMEKFSVSVNIAANSNVIFVLTYEELLQRHLGKYEMMIRVKPKQLVQNFQIVADIYEPQGIAFLDAYGTFMSNDLLPLVEKTVTDKKAHVSFSPTLEQQRACEDCTNTLIDGDFFIKYDVNRAELIGDIQIVNGYFVHFFAPADLPRIPKNVVFVIDISYSMKGAKIRQTREALVTILNDLHEEDYFGIIQFDHQIHRWSPSLKKASPENVKEAVAFAQNIVYRGSTNINDAAISAVNMIVNDTNNNLLPTKSASMIILLTDGDPTSGETNIPTIQENVRNAIGGNITLFCLGFGYDLNYGFLDVMAKQNNGLARRIYEASDAVLQLQGFYDEVASPLLLEVDLHYPETMVNSLTTSHFKQLFNGSEIVVAGRLNELEMNNFLIEVSAQGLDEDFAVKGQASAQDWDVIFPEGDYIFGDFTERLWAYLTIQQLLNNENKRTPEEKANATAKALDLSLQYSFVTPLTSMVVTKPQTDEKETTLIADKLTEAQRPKSDPWGSHQAAPVSHNYRYSSPVYAVDGDPHFIIELPDKNDSLCFNIDDTPGTIFNLVKDTESGIFVNGQTIGDKKVDPGSKVNTYFGSFGIVHEKLDIRLLVTTHDITVSEKGKQMLLFWSDSASIKGLDMELKVTKGRSLTVTLRDSVKFVILLHKVWEKHPYHQDYLGFYTLDTHLLPHSVHGLLGQFYHGVRFEVSEMYPGQDSDKPDATMLVKGQKLVVTRGWQRDFRHDLNNGEKVPCWFIHNNGTGLIDGTHEDYTVSGLFKI